MWSWRYEIRSDASTPRVALAILGRFRRHRNARRGRSTYSPADRPGVWASFCWCARRASHTGKESGSPHGPSSGTPLPLRLPIPRIPWRSRFPVWYSSWWFLPLFCDRGWLPPASLAHREAVKEGEEPFHCQAGHCQAGSAGGKRSISRQKLHRATLEKPQVREEVYLHEYQSPRTLESASGFGSPSPTGKDLPCPWGPRLLGRSQTGHLREG